MRSGGNPRQQLARRVALAIADDRRPSAELGHDRTLGHGVDGVVGAFAVHVRRDETQQPLDVRVGEHDDVVDAAEGGDELGALRRRQDRTPFTFQRRDRCIVVDRDDQAIGFLGGGLQVAHVADVQQIEAAVRKGDRLPRRAITRGSRGMALFQQRQPTIHVPIFGADEVADVTGAGDTVIAAFSLALTAGASFYEAARLANYAGGIVVMKRGTATVSARELSDAVISDHDTTLESWSQEGPPQGRRSLV